MAEMSTKMICNGSFSINSIYAIAKSISIDDLPEESVKDLAQDVFKKMGNFIKDAKLFMEHASHEKINVKDIEQALKIRNVEPQFGFIRRDFLLHRFAANAEQGDTYADIKDLDISELSINPQPKITSSMTLRGNWIAVKGHQAILPENPPPNAGEEQYLDSVDPVVNLENQERPAKQTANVEIAVTEQLLYKKLTEACIGRNEKLRTEALRTINCDLGLHAILPRLVHFIGEEVRANLARSDCRLLMCLMSMARAIVENPYFHLEKYLHHLLPSVVTCIVCNTLCADSELDNHFELRDFAVRILALLCRKFDTSANSLQTRVTRVLSNGFINKNASLPTLYGCIEGYLSLGKEVIITFIIPRLKFISARIEKHLKRDAKPCADKTAAERINSNLIKCCAPIIEDMRVAPDVVKKYIKDYGYIGAALCTAVNNSRNSQDKDDPMTGKTTK